MLSGRKRTLLVMNGAGLLITSVVVGWFYFFFLLGGIELWPFIEDVPLDVGGDRRAWNMAHLEAITNGLILLALAAVAPYIRLSPRGDVWLFYSFLVFTWLFTLPAIANAFFGTRGLAFGGGPFEGGIANNIIFLIGWLPMIAVHIGLPLFLWGAWRHLQSLGRD